MPFVLRRSWCAAPCFRIGSSLPYSSGAPHMIRKEGLPGFLIGLLLLSGLVAAADVPARAQESAWTQLPWDERIGLGWYRQLAERGDPEAQYRLGLLHEEGVGEAADPAAARDWYRAAAHQGHAAAQFALARLVQFEDPEAAVQWYRRAAEAGSPGAAFNLALILENGQGVPVDREAAARLYEFAFAEGVEQAALNRGLLEMKRLEPDGVAVLAWLLRAERAEVPSAGEAADAVAADLSAAERAQAQRLASRDPD